MDLTIVVVVFVHHELRREKKYLFKNAKGQMIGFHGCNHDPAKFQTKTGKFQTILSI